MSGVFYYCVLLVAAWFELPPLVRNGQRREAAVWLLLALAAAVLGAIWLLAEPEEGIADLLSFR